MNTQAQPEPVYLNPEAVARAVGGKARGNRVTCHAPGHKKGSAEISIKIDPSAPRGILVNCFSGEDPVEMKDWVLRQCGEPDFAPAEKSDRPEPTARLKLVKTDDAPKRFYDRHLTSKGYSHAATYDYATSDGELLFQVLRYEHPTDQKEFLQRRPDGNSGWFSGRGEPILYRWPEIVSRPGEPVYIVEGEKDADTLINAGLLATTAPNGSWPDDLSPLKGRTLYVIPDNDVSGADKADKVIGLVQGIAMVRRVELPDLPEKGDVTDWLQAGFTVEQLKALSRSAPPVAANQNKPSWPGIISSGDFVRGFVPPDYAIDGIVQAGFVYSVTASSGTGKTAILLLLTALTALGKELGNREVRKGRAIYFAGENPDDVTMRWIAQAHHMGFNPDQIDVHFVPGVFSIPGLFEEVSKAVKELGGADLIIVDTSAAYFQGADENANVDMGRHARDLRTLTTVDGHPCVLVACHPTKSADQSNLLPRGGGAFIAEMDGNLTCAKVGDGTVKLHWQGKHRGPDFEPVIFDLSTVTAPLLKDSKGRDVPTVMAQALSTSEARGLAASSRRDEDDALLQIDRDVKASLVTIADNMGWKRDDGSAHKDRARRATDKLRKDKLVTYEGRKWKITSAGFDALTDIRADRHREAQTAQFVARAAEKSAVRTSGYAAHDQEDD
ncbi:AAA family ATPase [Rhizobium leucaenae]|uniref:AAA family ATPase n=1 Tax=Rhizobium leucaenae TaxID=29450 RepID=UPI001616B0CC|nr:AAA family ATPase [Rhizobium leucaenae]MBB6299421.1 hypothetical protein [Rhizobium leucaenae]